MEIVRSNKGKDKILLDGYTYVKHADCFSIAVIRWRCSKASSVKCRAILTTTLDKTYPHLKIPHNHPPPPARKPYSKYYIKRKYLKSTKAKYHHHRTNINNHGPIIDGLYYSDGDALLLDAATTGATNNYNNVYNVGFIKQEVVEYSCVSAGDTRKSSIDMDGVKLEEEESKSSSVDNWGVDAHAFVGIVSEFPCVYDAADKDFVDHRKREAAWKIIKQRLGTDKKCSSRWKVLRDKYFDVKKEYRRALKAGHPEDEAKPKWDLYPVLERMLDSKPRKKICTQTNYAPETTNRNTDGLPLVREECEAYPILPSPPSPLSELRHPTQRVEETGPLSERRILSGVGSASPNPDARVDVPDEAYYYAMSLVPRIRSLPLPAMRRMRLEIEKLFYAVEYPEDET